MSELNSFFDAENWGKKEMRANCLGFSPFLLYLLKSFPSSPPPKATAVPLHLVNQSAQKFQLKLPVRSFHLPPPNWAARGCICLQAYWNDGIFITLLKYHTWKAVWGLWAWCTDMALERVIHYLFLEPPSNSLLYRNPPEGALTRNVWRPYGEAQRDKVLMVTDFLEKVEFELV